MRIFHDLEKLFAKKRFAARDTEHLILDAEIFFDLVQKALVNFDGEFFGSNFATAAAAMDAVLVAAHSQL